MLGGGRGGFSSDVHCIIEAMICRNGQVRGERTWRAVLVLMGVQRD